MKNLILILLLALTGVASEKALALPTSDNYGVQITADINTVRTIDNQSSCSASGGQWKGNNFPNCPPPATCHRWCPIGFENATYDKACCWDCGTCDAVGNELTGDALAAREEEVKVKQAQLASGSLDGVFKPELTDVFWGYNGATVRSPNNGRATSAHARLDACLNYTDVDTITASGWNLAGEQGCETNCGNGNVNEYCNQNTAAVCKDRCACLYQYNGVGSLTCNNL
jgi:hypothetical protein